MANLDIAEPFRPKEGRLHLSGPLAGYEVRITTTRVVGGEAAALRLLDSRRMRRPLDSLGFSPAALALVHGILRHGEGLVLVTGPTNSGKTTTVYSMLHELDNGERNIVTIEDPVEYEVPSFRQMGVDPRHDVTMTSGLRTLLRMDPDVVLVGEIRDADTAEIAMRAASSGKRVLSTLHTRDVASTVTALRDLHVDRRSLSGNLAGIISQRLVRRVCEECRRIESPTDEERDFLSRAGYEPAEHVAHAVGCERCGGTGYFERIGVFEIAARSPALGTAIVEGATEEEMRKLLRQAQVATLVDDALEKVRAGVTSVAEVAAMTWISVKPGLEESAVPPAQSTRDSSWQMPAVPPSAYRVVIYAAPDDACTLRDLLVARLNMHPTDAMIQAQRAPGILPAPLTQDVAQQIAAVVNDSGLHAEAVPEREIPAFEHAEAVHHARCVDNGFEIIELHGQAEVTVPWSEIELISVGQVPQEEDRHFVTHELITAASSTMPTECVVTHLPGLELWLIRREPQQAFRIDHTRMNYEYLGPEKNDSATHNFRLLLEELLRRAPRAYVTPATRSFVEHGPLSKWQFESSDDLREYTAFHLLIRLRTEKQATK
jgi:hypothetical protein